MQSIETSKEYIAITFIKILQIFLILANFTINSHKATEEIFIEILSYALLGLAIAEAANNSRVVAELLQQRVLKRSQIVMRFLQTLVACLMVLITRFIFGNNITYLGLMVLLINMSVFSFVVIVLRGYNKLYLSQFIWVSFWLLSLLLQLQCSTELALVTSSFCIALFSLVPLYIYIDFEFDSLSVKSVKETLILGMTGIIDAIVRRLDLLILLQIISSAELAAYYLLQKNFDLFNQASQVLKAVYLNLTVLENNRNLGISLISIIWSLLMLFSYLIFKFYIFEYFSSYSFNTAIFVTFGFSGLLTYILTPLGLNKILDKKYTQILFSSVVCFIISCLIWWLALRIDNLEVFALALPIGILSQIFVLRMIR